MLLIFKSYEIKVFYLSIRGASSMEASYLAKILRGNLSDLPSVCSHEKHEELLRDILQKTPRLNKYEAVKGLRKGFPGAEPKVHVMLHLSENLHSPTETWTYRDEDCGRSAARSTVLTLPKWQEKNCSRSFAADMTFQLLLSSKTAMAALLPVKDHSKFRESLHFFGSLQSETPARTKRSRPILKPCLFNSICLDIVPSCKSYPDVAQIIHIHIHTT